MRFCSVDKIFEFPLDLKFTPGDTIVMVKKFAGGIYLTTAILKELQDIVGEANISVKED